MYHEYDQKTIIIITIIYGYYFHTIGQEIIYFKSAWIILLFRF